MDRIDRIAVAHTLWVYVLAAGCSGMISEPAPGKLAPGAPAPGAPASRAPAPSGPGSGAQPPTQSPGILAPGVTASGCTPVGVGESPLATLTKVQYNATVADLLGSAGDFAAGFPEDSAINGFERGTDVSPLLVEGYFTAARKIAAAVAARMPVAFACDPVAKGADVCGHQFVTSFATRAYRRPVGASDEARLFAIFDAGRKAAGFPGGIQLVTEAILSSPRFLFLVEASSMDRTRGEIVPADDFDVASRLSYALWNAPPDDALFAAALRGELHQPAVIELQVRRMLADPRTRPGFRHFFRQWLGLDVLSDFQRDKLQYPKVDVTTGVALRQSTYAFVDYAMRDTDGRVETLFSSPAVFVNKKLAALWGWPAVASDSMIKQDRPPAERAGLVTQPGLMATLSLTDQTSPFKRGAFVREQLLCAPLPEPPQNVPALPAVDPKATTRQRVLMHRSDPACSACHALFDTIGLGLENYDAVGAFRQTDNGRPIDATGSLNGTDDINGSFTGGPELARKLRGSRQMQNCVVRQVFRYMSGRTEGPQDQCIVSRLEQIFASSNGDLRALVAAVAVSDTTLFTRVGKL